MKNKRSANYSSVSRNKLKSNLSLMPKRNHLSGFCEPLTNLNRMPTISNVIGRSMKLYNENIKSKQERVNIIFKELCFLWNQFNFPVQSKRSISRKILNTMKKYEQSRKRSNSNVKFMKDIFDVTHVKGNWLSSEDEILSTAIINMGLTGYTTGKAASSSSIHPSKRTRSLETTNEIDQAADNVSIIEDSNEVDEEITENIKISERQKTDQAALLVLSGISTHKASKACKILDNDKGQIPTLSQSGICRKAIRKGLKAKKQMKRSYSTKQE